MICQPPELAIKSLTGEPVSINDPLPTHGIIIIVGHTGAGKTTLLNSFLSRSTVAENKLYLDFSCTQISEVKHKFQTCLDEGQRDRIFAIDSFEKVIHSSNISQVEIVVKLASKLTANMCGSVIIATRNSGLNFLYSHLDKVHKHFYVEGFSDRGWKEFIMSSLPDSTDILKFIEDSPVLLDLCKIPAFSKELCLQYSMIKRTTSVTAVVDIIILNLIKRQLDLAVRGRVKNFDSLPTDEHFGFMTVCKLAFQYSQFGQKFEDIESSSFFLSSFCLKEGLSSIASIKSLDLIDYCENTRYLMDLTKTIFWFSSLHIQEFLCGYYLYTLPPLDQIFFLCEHAKDWIDNGYHGWLRYFYGFASRASGKQFSPTGMMINSVNELLLQCLDLEKSVHVVVFLTSLVETGEKSYWRKLGSRKDKIFDITLSVTEFVQARKGLIALVEYSGIKDWTLEASESDVKQVEELIGRTKSNVSVSPNDSLMDDVRLRPRMEISTAVEDRKYKSRNEGPKHKARYHHFSCRALREILQRVLQLYSKPKLKGDSSNPSYLSFLSCKCLEVAMDNHVSLIPVVPMHFLSVPKKEKILMSETDLTTVHLNQEHGGDALELVIILQPTLRRITFILPGSSKEFEMNLSSDDLHEMLTFEPPYASEDEMDDMTSITRSQELFPTRTQHVYPKFAVPLEHPELRGGSVVIPESYQQKKSTSEWQPMADREDDEDIETKAREGEDAQFEAVIESETGADTFGMFGNDYEGLSDYESRRQRATTSKGSDAVKLKSFHQEIADSGGDLLVIPSIRSRPLKSSSTSFGGHSHSSRRQQNPATKPPTAMKPGTVTFSVIPERLSTEIIHTLPDERSPLQVGGNGVILHGELKGMKVAIKKTAYRTRELNIMMKVNHVNVLRLLAFMWGEENPQHRRHYFAYHYYDLYHGDLARMVTDNRDMVLSKLHKVHEHDIAFMGRIRGNLIYILSNILRGLAYLHSMHVAHRLQGLKCVNQVPLLLQEPLTCPCHEKCRVVVCDFDAAIQLSDLDELPPASVLSSGRHVEGGELYQCLLVGTTGFRAPECAFEALANDPRAFSPPISCRCDIFSFGVFCLRFFVAEDGPRTQKVLATLLLGYHLRKSGVRRIAKPRRIEVTAEKMDKVLKLPKLRSDMSWLKYSADFVASCLKVDPHERSSANMLLAHPFIRGDTYR